MSGSKTQTAPSEVIMPAATMRQLLTLAKNEPVNAAIGLTEDNSGVILMHKQAQPKQVRAMLANAASKAGLKLRGVSIRFGRASVGGEDADGEEKNTTVVFTVNKDAPNSMAVRLREVVKPLAYTKIVFRTDPSLDADGATDQPATPGSDAELPSGEERARLTQSADTAEKVARALLGTLGNDPGARPFLINAVQDLKLARQRIESGDVDAAAELLRAVGESLRQAREVSKGQTGQTQPETTQGLETPLSTNPEQMPSPTLNEPNSILEGTSETPETMGDLPPPQRTLTNSEQVKQAITRRMMTSEELINQLNVRKGFSSLTGIEIWPDFRQLEETVQSVRGIDSILSVKLSELDPNELPMFEDQIDGHWNTAFEKLKERLEQLKRERETAQDEYENLDNEHSDVDDRLTWLRDHDDPEDDEEPKDDANDKDKLLFQAYQKLTEEEREEELERLEKQLDALTERRSGASTRDDLTQLRVQNVEAMLKELDRMRQRNKEGSLTLTYERMKSDPSFDQVSEHLTLGEGVHAMSDDIPFSKLTLNPFNDGTLNKENSIENWKGGGMNTVSLLEYESGVRKVFKPHPEFRGSGQNDIKSVGLRNVASVSLGEMLAPGLLVGTQLNTHNGTVGILMDLAPGDLRQTANRKLLNCSDKKLASLQQNLNKLEWIDTLTGQKDRSENNFLIDVDSDVDFVKVTGIDNDVSFGESMTTIERTGGNKNIPAKPILIDRQTYDNLMKIDPEKVRQELEGLNETEVEMTLTRLALLRQRAEELSNSGHVVDDWETWKDPETGKTAGRYLLDQPMAQRNLFANHFSGHMTGRK